MGSGAANNVLRKITNAVPQPNGNEVKTSKNPAQSLVADRPSPFIEQGVQSVLGRAACDAQKFPTVFAASAGSGPEKDPSDKTRYFRLTLTRLLAELQMIDAARTDALLKQP